MQVGNGDHLDLLDRQAVDQCEWEAPQPEAPRSGKSERPAHSRRRASPWTTFGLPLPADPLLQGLPLTAQSLHLENDGGVAASAGLSLTIR